MKKGLVILLATPLILNANAQDNIGKEIVKMIIEKCNQYSTVLYTKDGEKKGCIIGFGAEGYNKDTGVKGIVLYPYKDPVFLVFDEVNKKDYYFIGRLYNRINGKKEGWIAMRVKNCKTLNTENGEKKGCIIGFGAEGYNKDTGVKGIVFYPYKDPVFLVFDEVNKKDYYFIGRLYNKINGKKEGWIAMRVRKDPERWIPHGEYYVGYDEDGDFAKFFCDRGKCEEESSIAPRNSPYYYLVIFAGDDVELANLYYKALQCDVEPKEWQLVKVGDLWKKIWEKDKENHCARYYSCIPLPDGGIGCGTRDSFERYMWDYAHY